MTRKEFERLSKEIQKEKFQCGTGNPLQFAVERAKFRQGQFKKLIDAGRKVKGSRTVTAKVARYERSLQRLRAVPERFRSLIREADEKHRSFFGCEADCNVSIREA